METQGRHPFVYARIKFLRRTDDKIFFVGREPVGAFAFDLKAERFSGDELCFVPQAQGQAERVEARAEVGRGGGDFDEDLS